MGQVSRPGVHMEANPNPAAMKFVLDRPLLGMGRHRDFPSLADAKEAPMAQALFQKFAFVGRVFIMSNFVTLTRNQDVDWYEIGESVCAFIADYIEKGGAILTETHAEKAKQASPKTPEEALFARIQQTLDEYVRPAVERDGGAISLHSFEDGVVRVHLQGACSGCPSATLTLKAGIENLLKRMIPEVKAVEAEPA